MKKKCKNCEYKKCGEQRFGKDLSFASGEAYNLLSTNLSFSFPDKTGGRVIGITSACPQDGKSTTAINLAYSLADSGNRVILIDADMRRPSVAKMININVYPGLSNLLIEDTDSAVRANTMHKNMSVLPAGDIPPNPTELIRSERMCSIMERFREEYDYVIVDMPPVNAVADPLVISKCVDGMILVVRHDSTKRRDISEAVRQLRLVDARLLGFVYNDAEY